MRESSRTPQDDDRETAPSDSTSADGDTSSTSAVSIFAVHARYRGRVKRRADHVRASAEALDSLDSVVRTAVVGVDELSVYCADADAVAEIVLIFLSAGDWGVGIGVGGYDPGVLARKVAGSKAGAVGTFIATISSTPGVSSQELATDIAAAFQLVGYVLARRTDEGREATNLMRQGLTQTAAAEQLGITKQAMSQRLAAAGWQAEQAGWVLAVHLLQRAAEL